jgi:hypothetical protein
MSATNSYAIYNYGFSAGQQMSATNSHDIYNYGTVAGYQMSATNSIEIYSHGHNALRSARLTNSSEVYAIGRAAGTNLVGSYTNIYLIGNNAQPTLTANQMVFGDSTVANYRFPGQSLVVAGSAYVDTANTTSNRVFSLTAGSGITFTTNGPLLSVAASSSYASATMGTGTVTIATSASTNVMGSFANVLASGSMSIQTNQTIICTNAGNYQIEFGSFIAGANTDVLKCLVFTNGVHCSIASIGFTATAQQVNETGFKSFIVALPASCAVDLRVANLNAASMTVQNTCLVVQRR